MTTQPFGLVPTWTVADRLRKSRELTGQDQAAFADSVGISRTSVGNAERGDVVPRRLTLKMWAMATGVNLQWLETGQAPVNPGPDDALCAARDSNPEPAVSRWVQGLQSLARVA